jgi:hypothetical protein
MKKVRKRREQASGNNSSNTTSDGDSPRELNTIPRVGDDIGRVFGATIGSNGSEDRPSPDASSSESIDQRNLDSDDSASGRESAPADTEPDDSDTDSDSGFGSYRRRKRIRRRNSSSRDSGNSARENRASSQRDDESVTGIEPEPEPEPKVIDFASFRKGKKQTRRRTKDSEVLTAIQKGIDTAFSVPVYLHWGNHWQISDDDARELSEKIYDAYKALPPSESIKWLIAMLEKGSPFLALAITAGSMIYPRYLVSTEIYKNAQNEQRQQPGVNTPSAGQPSAAGNQSTSERSSNGDKVNYKSPFTQQFGKIG